MYLIPAIQIARLFEHYGYSFFVFCLALEGLGIPMAGETRFLSAAAGASQIFTLSIPVLIFCAFLGAMLGDAASYFLARKFGRNLLYFCEKNFSLSPTKSLAASTFFSHYCGKIVFFSQFISFLRVLSGLCAGTFDMAPRRFFIMSASGAALWAIIFGLSAYMLGDNLKACIGPFRWLSVAVVFCAALILGGRVKKIYFALLQNSEPIKNIKD